eukprot:g45.t1
MADAESPTPRGVSVTKLRKHLHDDQIISLGSYRRRNRSKGSGHQGAWSSSVNTSSSDSSLVDNTLWDVLSELHKYADAKQHTNHSHYLKKVNLEWIDLSQSATDRYSLRLKSMSADREDDEVDYDSNHNDGKKKKKRKKKKRSMIKAADRKKSYKFPALGFTLDAFPKLKRLDLSGNLISIVENLHPAEKSKKNLQTMTSGDESPLLTASSPKRLNSNQQQLYLIQLSLARNRIRSLEKNCFTSLSHLQRLDLSGNFLQHVPTAVTALVSLQWLDLSGNNIFQNFESEIRKLNSMWNLTWLFLLANPCVDLPHYRNHTILALGQISSLDGTAISSGERDSAKLAELVRSNEEASAQSKKQSASKTTTTTPARKQQVTRGGKIDVSHVTSRYNEASNRTPLRKSASPSALERSAKANRELRKELLATEQLLHRKSSEWARMNHKLAQVQQELEFLKIDNPSKTFQLTDIERSNHPRSDIQTTLETRPGESDQTQWEQPGKQQQKEESKTNHLHTTTLDTNLHPPTSSSLSSADTTIQDHNEVYHPFSPTSGRLLSPETGWVHTLPHRPAKQISVEDENSNDEFKKKSNKRSPLHEDGQRWKEDEREIEKKRGINEEEGRHIYHSSSSSGRRSPAERAREKARQDTRKRMQESSLAIEELAREVDAAETDVLNSKNMSMDPSSNRYSPLFSASLSNITGGGSGVADPSLPVIKERSLSPTAAGNSSATLNGSTTSFKPFSSSRPNTMQSSSGIQPPSLRARNSTTNLDASLRGGRSSPLSHSFQQQQPLVSSSTTDPSSTSSHSSLQDVMTSYHVRAQKLLNRLNSYRVEQKNCSVSLRQLGLELEKYESSARQHEDHVRIYAENNLVNGENELVKRVLDLEEKLLQRRKDKTGNGNASNHHHHSFDGVYSDGNGDAVHGPAHLLLGSMHHHRVRDGTTRNEDELRSDLEDVFGHNNNGHSHWNNSTKIGSQKKSGRGDHRRQRRGQSKANALRNEALSRLAKHRAHLTARDLTNLRNSLTPPVKRSLYKLSSVFAKSGSFVGDNGGLISLNGNSARVILKPSDLFDAIDRNGDGVISRSELRSALEQLKVCDDHDTTAESSLSEMERRNHKKKKGKDHHSSSYDLEKVAHSAHTILSAFIEILCCFEQRSHTLTVSRDLFIRALDCCFYLLTENEVNEGQDGSIRSLAIESGNNNSHDGGIYQLLEVDTDPIDAVRDMLNALHEEQALLKTEQAKIDNELRRTQEGIAALAEQAVTGGHGHTSNALADILTLEKLAHERNMMSDKKRMVRVSGNRDDDTLEEKKNATSFPGLLDADISSLTAHMQVLSDDKTAVSARLAEVIATLNIVEADALQLADMERLLQGDEEKALSSKNGSKSGSKSGSKHQVPPHQRRSMIRTEFRNLLITLKNYQNSISNCHSKARALFQRQEFLAKAILETESELLQIKLKVTQAESTTRRLQFGEMAKLLVEKDAIIQYQQSELDILLGSNDDDTRTKTHPNDDERDQQRKADYFYDNQGTKTFKRSNRHLRSRFHPQLPSPTRWKVVEREVEYVPIIDNHDQRDIDTRNIDPYDQRDIVDTRNIDPYDQRNINTKNIDTYDQRGNDNYSQRASDNYSQRAASDNYAQRRNDSYTEKGTENYERVNKYDRTTEFGSRQSQRSPYTLHDFKSNRDYTSKILKQVSPKSFEDYDMKKEQNNETQHNNERIAGTNTKSARLHGNTATATTTTTQSRDPRSHYHTRTQRNDSDQGRFIGDDEIEREVLSFKKSSSSLHSQKHPHDDLQRYSREDPQRHRHEDSQRHRHGDSQRHPHQHLQRHPHQHLQRHPHGDSQRHPHQDPTITYRRGQEDSKPSLLDSLKDLFHSIDKNDNGKISRSELIIRLRKMPWMADLLKVPQHIHQEDGTRDIFEHVFQRIDTNSDGTIDLEEFLNNFKLDQERMQDLRKRNDRDLRKMRQGLVEKNQQQRHRSHHNEDQESHTENEGGRQQQYVSDQEGKKRYLVDETGTHSETEKETDVDEYERSSLSTNKRNDHENEEIVVSGGKTSSSKRNRGSEGTRRKKGKAQKNGKTSGTSSYSGMKELEDDYDDEDGKIVKYNDHSEIVEYSDHSENVEQSEDTKQHGKENPKSQRKRKQKGKNRKQKTLTNQSL